MLSGLTIQFTEAGLITPIGGMSSISFRPLITTGYIQNSPILRQPNPGLTYINPVSPTPMNGANSWFYVNRPTIQKGVLTQNPWFSGSTPSAVFNIPTGVPKTDNTPDYDAILAQRFPDAYKLLEELRRLNKKKEEQRKKEQRPNVSEGTTGEPDSKSDNIFTPDVKDIGHMTTTQPSMINGKYVMTKLTKKKFYQQAQPVRPESEKPETKEVVYFIDT